MPRSKKRNRGPEGSSSKTSPKKKVKEDPSKKAILPKKTIGTTSSSKSTTITTTPKKIKLATPKIVYSKKKGKGKVVKNCYCSGGSNWKLRVKKGPQR